MYIYRIQNDDGVGYVKMKKHKNYRVFYKLKYEYSHELADGSERHQYPDADYGTPLANAYFNKQIYSGSPLIFGFATIKDIYTWFCPATIGYFEANGYYIYVYNIDEKHVIRGTRQVVFNPIHAISKTKISHKSLRHYQYREMQRL